MDGMGKYIFLTHFHCVRTNLEAVSVCVCVCWARGKLKIIFLVLVVRNSLRSASIGSVFIFFFLLLSSFVAIKTDTRKTKKENND